MCGIAGFVNKNIESTIFEKILDENTIADNASPKLSSIRKNKKKAEQAIRDKLDSIIHSSSYSKYLMEPIVTIRNSAFALIRSLSFCILVFINSLIFIFVNL